MGAGGCPRPAQEGSLNDEWLIPASFAHLEGSPVMLVLSRRLNEKIVLPGLGVTLTVISVKGNGVRLGIEAPPDVQVLREELVAEPTTDHRKHRAELCTV